MLTKQEIYNIVAKHLLTQNKKAATAELNDALCRYRTESGLKCAVGCLIPDEVYNPSIENIGVKQLYDNRLLLSLKECQVLSNAIRYGIDCTEEKIPKEILVFLQELQIIHDNSPVSKWAYYLQSFACRHDLMPYTPEVSHAL